MRQPFPLGMNHPEELREHPKPTLPAYKGKSGWMGLSSDSCTRVIHPGRVGGLESQAQAEHTTLQVLPPDGAANLEMLVSANAFE